MLILLWLVRLTPKLMDTNSHYALWQVDVLLKSSQHLAGEVGECWIFGDWSKFPPSMNTVVMPELTTTLKEDMGQRLGALKLSHGCSSRLSGVWLWFLVSLFTAGQRAVGRYQSQSCWLVFFNPKSGRKTYRLPPENTAGEFITLRFVHGLFLCLFWKAQRKWSCDVCVCVCRSFIAEMQLFVKQLGRSKTLKVYFWICVVYVLKVLWHLGRLVKTPNPQNMF